MNELVRAFSDATRADWSEGDSFAAMHRVERRLVRRQRLIVASNVSAVLMAIGVVCFALFPAQPSDSVSAADASTSFAPPARVPAPRFAIVQLKLPKQSNLALQQARKVSTREAPVVANEPTKTVQEWLALSDRLRSEGQLLRAAAVLEPLREQSFLVSFTLGKIYADMGERAKAAAAFARVYALWPECGLAKAAKEREAAILR